MPSLWYPYLDISETNKKCLKVLFQKNLKKSFSCFIKVMFYLKREYIVCQIRCFKNEFSGLTGATSTETSSGLCTGVNSRGKVKHCCSQALIWKRHSCTFGLYPFSITLEISDLQIFGYFKQWMFASRNGLNACMDIWVIKVERNIMKGSCLS